MFVKRLLQISSANTQDFWNWDPWLELLRCSRVEDDSSIICSAFQVLLVSVGPHGMSCLLIWSWQCYSWANSVNGISRSIRTVLQQRQWQFLVRIASPLVCLEASRCDLFAQLGLLVLQLNWRRHRQYLISNVSPCECLWVLRHELLDHLELAVLQFSWRWQRQYLINFPCPLGWLRPRGIGCWIIQSWWYWIWTNRGKCSICSV